MAGDIYSIDVRLENSSQTVSIVKDSIILSAIVSFKTRNQNEGGKVGEVKLLDNNDNYMHRFFYKRNDRGQDWESIELPIKKHKLNAGEQLQFIAHCERPPEDRTYFNAKITLMEV